MKELVTQRILLYNPETKEHEPIDALRGESAYEAAVRQGLTDLSEEEWLRDHAGTLNEIIRRSDSYLEMIEQKEENQIGQNVVPAVTKNASGKIVQIEDSAALPSVRLTTNIEPVQSGSGDPSPTNVRTISGHNTIEVVRTRKNLFSRKDIKPLPYTINGITFSDGGDGKIAISGTATATASMALINRGAGKRDFIKAGTYTVSGSANQTNAAVYYVFYADQEVPMTESFLTVQTSYGSPQKTFTLDRDCYYGCYVAVVEGKTPEGYIIPQLEMGTEVTEFEPYEGENITATLPETVYGGSLDWATGVLTVDAKIITLDGSSDETMRNGAYNDVTIIVPDAKVTPLDQMGIVACSMARPIAGVDRNSSGARIYAMNLTGSFNVRGIATTADELRAVLGETPMTVVYKIAEPYTIQLTPHQLSLLKGQNNIFGSGGPIELTYSQDPDIHMEDKFNQLSDERLQDKADAIILNKDGSIISMSDSDNKMVRQQTTNISLCQGGSGDPSPTNIRSLTGWNTIEIMKTGKNMMPPLMKGVRIHSTDGREMYESSYATTPYIPYDGKTTLFMSGMPSTLSNFVAFYDSNKNFIGRTSGNLGVVERLIFAKGRLNTGKYCNGARYFRLCVYVTTSTDATIDEIDSAQIQLEQGETPTQYEPYDADIIAVDLPETVYGGTLDWVTGVLTVDRFGKVLDGTETFVYQSITLAGASGFYIRLSDYNMPVPKYTDVTSSHFVSKTAGQYGTTMNAISTNNTKANIVLNVDSTVCGSTINEFKNFLSAQKAAGTPVVISYVLAEPYTIQLTPRQLLTLKQGENFVRSNSGETHIEYIANLQKYIEGEPYVNKNISVVDSALTYSRGIVEARVLHDVLWIQDSGVYNLSNDFVAKNNMTVLEFKLPKNISSKIPDVNGVYGSTGTVMYFPAQAYENLTYTTFNCQSYLKRTSIGDYEDTYQVVYTGVSSISGGGICGFHLRMPVLLIDEN